MARFSTGALAISFRKSASRIILYNTRCSI
jgi:hypothetical protein